MFHVRPLRFRDKYLLNVSTQTSLFSNNLNAFEVNNDNKIQWKNIIINCSEITFSKNSYHIETSQLICKPLQLTGFYIRVSSERCLRTDYKTTFVFSHLPRAHDLTWQYINPGHSINALCAFNLGIVSVGWKTVNIYFIHNLFLFTTLLIF